MGKINPKKYYFFEVEEIVEPVDLGEVHHIFINRKPIRGVKIENGKYLTEESGLVFVNEDYKEFSKSTRSLFINDESMMDENEIDQGFKIEDLIDIESINGVSRKFLAFPVPEELYKVGVSMTNRAKNIFKAPIRLSENERKAKRQLEDIGIYPEAILKYEQDLENPENQPQ